MCKKFIRRAINGRSRQTAALGGVEGWDSFRDCMVEALGGNPLSAFPMAEVGVSYLSEGEVSQPQSATGALIPWQEGQGRQ